MNAAIYFTTHVGGFDTIVSTREELAEIMASDCARRMPDDLPKLVFSSNGQGISLAASDSLFMSAMRQADIVHADGMSVVMASRLFTPKPLPERICTTDFFEDAARVAIRDGLSFFFFGGTEAQNAKAVSAIQTRFPELKIVGRHHGYVSESEEAELCRKISALKPDVLWIALGKPLQEYWSIRNRSALGGIGWIKTCGGLYGYIAGEERRAPRWMRSYGLEWLFRAIHNPRKLFLRYIVTNPHALWILARRSK